MSRLAKKPITIPRGVEVSIDGLFVSVKGPKGELERTFHYGLEIKKEDNLIYIQAPSRESQLSKFLGLTYALLTNMINGVNTGAEKILDFNGIGFKATVKSNNLELNLGFSHPITVEAPAGIDFKVEKNRITVSGIDKELVGQVAAKIRNYRKPEPYKGTGIFYKDEVIIRKAGKKAATA